jgi:HK97 family phage portal protein
MLARLLRSEQRLVQDPYWNLWGSGNDGPLGGNTASGVAVNETTALQSLVVYSCVSFRADAISSLPVEQYRTGSDGVDEQIPLAPWVKKPNPDLSMMDLIGQFIVSLDLDGNFYGIPVRDRNGVVIEFWPLHPRDVQVRRETAGGPLDYYINGVRYPYKLAHVRAFMTPGSYVGLSAIGQCRQSIGNNLALTEFGGRFFSQGSTPSIIIEAPTLPDESQTIALREQFEQFNRGLKKAHGVAVIGGGATVRPISVNPNDSQFLETMNFNSAQIAAGIFRLNPEHVGASLIGRSSITYQNITDQWTEITRRAFMVNIRRFETMVSELLPGQQKVCLDLDMYTRADLKTRYDAYAVATGNQPWMTTAEVRAEEQLPVLSDEDLAALKPPPPVVVDPVDASQSNPAGQV